MKLKKTALSMLITCGTALAGCSQMMAEHKSMGVPDLTFIRNAGYVHQDEIAANNLAIEKTSDARIKSLAQHMVKDHTEAYGKLEKIAMQREIVIPDGPDPTHVLMATQLSSYGSPVFEKEYLAAQIADHAMVLEQFKAKYNSTGDATLKEYVGSLIPVIEHHLMMCRELAAKLS